MIGFVSGLGAATADAFYGAIAAFGVTAVSSFLLTQQRPIELVGGLVLFALGLRFLRSRPHAIALRSTESTTLLPAYTSTFLLTLTNPTTILSFGAAFASLGLAHSALGGRIRPPRPGARRLPGFHRLVVHPQ